ncbi:MAG: hypothetical protein NC331_00680 [Lachnospiraceae bacterium]|nr:hypothetical protein [Lachnospiraceae bacterium]MCM1237883.1 hypothetical protein [Lachnospiraceae bacterium]
MWEGKYGKEPFDLRLTVLRLIASLDKVLVFTLAGTLLFGGGYYVKNVLMRSEKQYGITSTYRVEYAVEEEKDIGIVYINEMSWNTYLHSQEFLDMVMAHLEEEARFYDSDWPDQISAEQVSGSLTAYLASDLRVPSTTVITGSGVVSRLIARAVEQAMTEDFPGAVREITDIRVIDAPETAEEVVPDVRPGRAFALSAVLSCFFTIVILLLKETGDDNIWLPATIRKRYGVKVAGTLESPGLSENLHYLYKGKKKVAVCGVQAETDPAEILAAVRGKCGEPLQTEEWFAAPSPLLCPESCRALREADGILLAVQAGAHAGKQLEYCLEYLRQQDCKVASVILWNADEKLIRAYYFGRRAAECGEVPVPVGSGHGV